MVASAISTARLVGEPRMLRMLPCFVAFGIAMAFVYGVATRHLRVSLAIKALLLAGTGMVTDKQDKNKKINNDKI